MLILTRSNGETIRVGDDIKITVIGQEPGEVRLHIELPGVSTIVNKAIRESLDITPEIRLTVLGESRGEARLGIEAPANVPIHREEVYERLKKEAP